jgi:hypothetical protein
VFIFAIVVRGVQLFAHMVLLRKKKPGRQDRQADELQVAQGVEQGTQVGGSMEVDPYIPEMHWATQN